MHDMPPSNAGRVQIDRHVRHEVSRVWQALTDPTVHVEWWVAGNISPVVGHRFDLDMGAWGTQACEVIEAKPGHRLAYRFAVGVLDTTVAWDLRADDTGTSVTLTHDGFDLDTALGRQGYEGMGRGWPGVLARMDAVLSK